MNSKKLLIILLVLVVMLVVGFGITRLCKQHLHSLKNSVNSECNCSGHLKSLKYLNLSKEQEKKIEYLDKQFNQSVGEKCKEFCNTREELNALLVRDEFDTDKIDKYTKKIAFGQAELEKFTIYHIFYIKQILTVEQKKKFTGIISKKLCEDLNNESMLQH
ncbi:MAG: hypothetical protein AABY84_09525 [Candidatus Firestonebacteria bacterium]